MSDQQHILPAGATVDVYINWTVPVDLDLCVFFTTADGRTGGVFSDEFRQDVNDLGQLADYPYMLHHGDEKEPMPGQRGVERVTISDLARFATVDVVVINYDDAIDLLDVDYRDNAGHCDIVIGSRTHTIPSAPDGKGQAYHVARITRQADGNYLLTPVNTVLTLRQAYDTIPGFALICE